MKIIGACDFLSYQPNLFIEGRNRYQNFVGVLFSILVILLSIGSTGYLAYQFLGRTNVKLSSSLKTSNSTLVSKLSNESISAFVALEDPNYNYYVDPTIFNVKAFKYTNFGEKAYKYVPIEANLCSKYYSQDDIIETTHYLNLSQFYCVKPNATQISGYWGSEIPYQLTRVAVVRCQNSTENNNHCKSPNQISERIQSGYISLLFSTYYFRPSNYTHPFEKVFMNLYYMLNAFASIELNLYYQVNTLLTDDAFLFYNSRKTIVPVLKQENIEKFYNLKPGDVISSFVINFHYNEKTYERTYMKVQDVLTQAGGLIKSIYLIGVILVMFPSKAIFIVSRISNLEDSMDNQAKIPVREVPIVNFIANKNVKNNVIREIKSNFSIDNQLKNSCVNPLQTQPLQFTRVKKSKFIRSYLSELVGSCCCKKQNNYARQKFSQSYTFYKNIISVENIVEKLLFIEVLSNFFTIKGKYENCFTYIHDLAMKNYNPEDKTKFFNFSEEEVVELVQMKNS